ncbi:hypothetical protein HWV62_13777 [Athelia sp. TMB]|nr:hypothetical protein HWV62_13777 [Athelia sp. TMB]
MPAAYTKNEFTSCEGELQDVVGVYTSAGQTYTWSEPQSLAPDTTLPWQPRVPASSNCVTYSSAQLFGTTSASSASSTGSAGASTSKASGGSSAPTSTATGTSGSKNGASKLAIGSGVFAGFAGLTVALSLLF